MASCRVERALGLPAAGLALTLASQAAAQGTIKNPGDHPHYVFEAEPHLAIGYRGGVGPGFRGTFAVLHNGFIPSLNNSIGIGFGADWIFYSDHCEGPAGARVCEARGDVLVPLVLQWNFWLIRGISVFGEPGVVFHFLRGANNDVEVDPFTLYGGARFHFSDYVALTIRLGAPQIFKRDSTFTLGVSFLL